MSHLFAMRSNGIHTSNLRRLAAVAGAVPAGKDSFAAADVPVEMVRTIAEVLDIRRVFPRVSAIAAQVLPHDGLALVFLDESNHLTLEARSAMHSQHFAGWRLPATRRSTS